jgi:hypothetical protein
MSIPCLVSASVGTIEASASMIAGCLKNASPWRCQTFSLERLTASCRAMIEAASKRRQKSPAVVGSGRLAVPRPSRNTRSQRRASMSSKRRPPHRAL